MIILITYKSMGDNNIDNDFHINEFKENITDLLRNGIIIKRIDTLDKDFIFPKYLYEKLMSYFPDKYIEVFNENSKLVKRNNELEELCSDLKNKLANY